MGCWSHARRDFPDLVTARPKTAPPGLADEALTDRGALFHREQRWTDVTAAQRQALRHRHRAPILAPGKAWLDRYRPATAPKTRHGKAIRYTRRFGTRLPPFFQEGRLALSNNATARAIKAVVIGRKNVRFATRPAGARALANLYALVETAKATAKEPGAYLNRLFSDLPRARPVEQREALLQWNMERAELHCRERRAYVPDAGQRQG